MSGNQLVPTRNWDRNFEPEFGRVGFYARDDCWRDGFDAGVLGEFLERIDEVG